MKDRILLLIKAGNLTAAQFADEIGVQKSSVSHILSGRNNPSLDFIQKILLRFPEVSIEWLLFGKGQLYKQAGEIPNPLPDMASPVVNDLFSTPVDLFSGSHTDLDTENALQNGLGEPEINQSSETRVLANPNSSNVKNMEISEPFLPPADHKKVPISSRPLSNVANEVPIKKVIKIVEFYNDFTFAEFRPES